MEERNSPCTLDAPSNPRPQSSAHQAPKTCSKTSNDPEPVITAEEFWKRLGL